MDEDEFESTIFIMETGPGPPAGRPRWYCYQREPGFDTPEEGVNWARTRAPTVMVGALTGTYYWVGEPPSGWDEGDGPLKPWPPSATERREIEPEVKTVDDSLRAWYGPEDNPVLALEPIQLADLRAR